MFQACGHSGHIEQIMGLVITEDKVFNTAASIYYKHYTCCALWRSGPKCNEIRCLIYDRKKRDCWVSYIDLYQQRESRAVVQPIELTLLVAQQQLSHEAMSNQRKVANFLESITTNLQTCGLQIRFPCIQALHHQVQCKASDAVVWSTPPLDSSDKSCFSI